jgi:hypothetical protein
MRRIVEVEEVTCNNCSTTIESESDLNVVTLSINGVEYTTDWCARCHHKLMVSVSYSEDPLACGYTGCEFVAKSEQGLQTHRSRKDHPRTRRGQL